MNSIQYLRYNVIEKDVFKNRRKLFGDFNLKGTLR
jgi:hypothetical protein